MSEIHSTAIIDKGAEISETACVGPYCVVGAGVVLHKGVRLESHVVVAGRTSIGANTTVFPFSSIGHPPQDKKYQGEESALVIGDNNIIREHVTMNPGTEGGGLVTRVGEGGLFMAGSHVAHDCQVGDHVIFANNATLAGHVTVGNYTIVGGLSAVHQFVRIGEHAMIGGMSGVEHDVIPFGSVLGNRAYLGGLNIIGLRRRGFPRDSIHALRRAYRVLFGEDGSLQERLETVARDFASNTEVMRIVEFLREDSSRNVCLPRVGRAA